MTRTDPGPPAGVVLAGGRSSRMGRPKATLAWGSTTLLGRTLQVLADAGCAARVVVAAPSQDLPDLPAGVLLVHDPVEGRGPLQGLAVGLAAAASSAAAADRAFVCSTDLPFLAPAYVRAVLAALAEQVDAVLPVVRGHRQPLAAAYRTALAGRCRDLVAADRLRPAFLLDAVRTVVLDERVLLADPALAAADPDLRSVDGVNTPQEYSAALTAEPRSAAAPGGGR